MTSASAPGKVILFGEHAVVYGRPALAVPVTQVQATASLSPLSAGDCYIEAPGIGLSASLSDLPAGHPLAALIVSTLATLGIEKSPSFQLRIDSTIPVASGLGSGAAVSVAVIRALAAFLGQPISDEKVSALAFEIEKLHHGMPSGIDNSVVTYAEPIFFAKGRPIEKLQTGRAFTLVIADTGVASPTKETVSDVHRGWQAETMKYERIFDAIGAIVIQARQVIQRGEVAEIGRLMNQNHNLLQEMGVSSPALDHLVEAARTRGALGAKLSGGGRGGNMIALVKDKQGRRLTEALVDAGAKRCIISKVG